MPFIPADGDNFETANSYCDVAYADDYHSLRGNDAWGVATTAKKQAALIKASDFIDQKYSGRFYGDGMTLSGLGWPRSGLSPVYADDVIPDGIKKACCELALEALKGALSPNIAPTGTVKRKKIDVLETEYFAPTAMTTVRPAVDAYMRGFLLPSSCFNVPVVRV